MNSLLSRIPKIRPRLLRLAIPACGALGLFFQLLLAATGTDEKGLMIPAHPAWIGLWLVTIAAALILALGVLSIHAPANHRAGFPRSIYGAAGCGLAAVSALTATLDHFRSGPGFSVTPLPTLVFFLRGALMLLAVAAFLLVALCRLTGKKPHFLLHVAVCIYFALQMLSLYQTWSFDPQLHEYCFQLFAVIALTMTAYQLAAFDMGKGSHRMLWAWSLAAVYLCCLSAPSGLFFITSGVWAFVSLSSLRRSRQRRPAEAEPPAE